MEPSLLRAAGAVIKGVTCGPGRRASLDAVIRELGALPGYPGDSKRVKGDMAHFHRPCLSDKRNLACSSTSRSLGFGSSDCSISPLARPFLCLDYLSFMFNRSVVYIPNDYLHRGGDDSCLE